MNPINAMRSFVAPGGRVSWVKIMLLVLGFSLFALLLFNIAKPILKFFGVGGTQNQKDREARETLNDQPSLPPDSPAADPAANPSTNNVDFSYLETYVDELKYVIEKTYWMLGYGAGSERCMTFKRCYDELDDNELARVVSAYKKKTGKSLKTSILELTWGCDNNFIDENHQRFDKLLIERIDSIYAGTA